MVGDTFKEDLGRTISEGRADNKPYTALGIAGGFVTRGILKQIALDHQSAIEKGVFEIKGIR